MAQTVLSFEYVNAAGEVSRRDLSKWQEVGYYVHGNQVDDGRFLTFRKDRITRYFDGCDALLDTPIAPAPPRLPRAESSSAPRPQDAKLEILFTGYPAVQRANLEALAAEAGLKVVQTVTTHLTFLCCGPNAGPAKVEKARAKNVYVFQEPDFKLLLQTGELPDAAVEALG